MPDAIPSDPPTETFRHALYGGLFGCLFPLVSMIFDLYVRQLDFSIANILHAQATQPLHWMIDTAPFFLGFFAGLAGKRQDRITRINLNLEREIAEHQRAERELQTAKKVAEVSKDAAEAASHAKSAFLSNMSHELRTPMNAVLGYAQILESDPGLSSRQRQAIQTIGSSGTHLLSLINDVLNMTQTDAGREELHRVDFDLRGLMRGLEAIFEGSCKQKNLGLRFAVEVPGVVVHGDENKLRQVLVNLLSNAVKFTGEGEVVLRLQARENDHFYFEVADTGPGIAPEHQNAVFEPFHQEAEGVREGGMGLGLTTARQHVKQMGGQLELESTPGEGARFFFVLSLPSERARPEEEKMSRVWSQVRGLAPGCVVRALIVDDVATNRNILGQMLKRIGVEIDMAPSGLQALKQVQQQRPDIVFMDLRMPVMDGVKARQRLVDEHGSEAMKIVAVTASARGPERQKYEDVGFDDFIDKPFRTEEIYLCLQRQLGVEFDSDEPVSVEADGLAVDWQNIELPEELSTGLELAVKMHSITELNKYLEVLDELGDGGQHLAAHLRDLSRQFDMPGIKSALEKIGSR
jgi:signal transduction histidine kinase/CheY-like chemotaxis protein